MARKKLTEVDSAVSFDSIFCNDGDKVRQIEKEKLSEAMGIDGIGEAVEEVGQKADQAIDIAQQANARVDNLVIATPGDAELLDIRTGADGKNYASAGTAVRSQITGLKQELTQSVCQNLMGMEYKKNYKLVEPIKTGEQLYITRADGSVFPTNNAERINVYDVDGKYVEYFSLKTGTTSKTTTGMKKDIYYLRWDDPNNEGAYDVPMMVRTLDKKDIPYQEYFENVRLLAETVEQNKKEFEDNLIDFAKCQNLIGMEYKKNYPLVTPIKAGTMLHIKKADGSVFPTDNTARLNVYDENGTYVESFRLNTGVESKTTSEMKEDIYFMRWEDPNNDGDYSVPMMVTTYENRNAPYVPYFENVRLITERFSNDIKELSKSIETAETSVDALETSVICKNLVGMEMNEQTYYPVDIEPNTYITISTSDGSIFPTDGNLYIYLYDENKLYLDRFALKTGLNFRTFITSASKATTKYMKYMMLDGSVWSVPLMCAQSNIPLPYEEYFKNPKQTTHDVVSLEHRNYHDITPPYSKKNTTHNGITYTWNGTECTISGTATATSHCTLHAYTSAIPEVFKTGKKLYIHYHVTDANIFFEINAVKMNGSAIESENAFVMRKSGWYTVPSDCDRVSIYIRVQKGATVHGKFSELGIYDSYPTNVIEQSPCLPLLVTITDDDTLTDEDVGHFHDCLMHNDVRGAYAFIGRRVEEAHTTTIAKLQEAEDDGFDVLPHCWTQQTYFTNTEDRDLSQCIRNMQRIKRYMSQHNLNSQEEWIVPYGVTDEGIRHVAKTLGFKMMFSSATKDFNRAIDTERYRVKRVGFHPTWTEQSNLQLDGIKDIFDKMVSYGGGWMIVCCHVKDWNRNNFPDNPEMWVDFDETLDAKGYPIGYHDLNAFIDYCKSKGATFVNVREGHQWIEPYLQNS